MALAREHKGILYHRRASVTVTVQENDSGYSMVTKLSICCNNLSNNELQQTSNKMLSSALTVLKTILDGNIPKNIHDLSLDFNGLTAFSREVLECLQTIPRGTTISYSELATLSGYPKAIRAVSSVVRKNRFPLIIPCHRVICKDGSIGGFMGDLKGASIDLKRILLHLEGIEK